MTSNADRALAATGNLIVLQQWWREAVSRDDLVDDEARMYAAATETWAEYLKGSEDTEERPELLEAFIEGLRMFEDPYELAGGIAERRSNPANTYSWRAIIRESIEAASK